jgi:hypothetical protein
MRYQYTIYTSILGIRHTLGACWKTSRKIGQVQPAGGFSFAYCHYFSFSTVPLARIGSIRSQQYVTHTSQARTGAGIWIETVALTAILTVALLELVRACRRVDGRKKRGIL